MNRDRQDHHIGRVFRQGAEAFLFSILFTLSLFVNQTEAGWIQTEGEDLAVKFIHTLQTGDLEQIKPYLDPRLLAGDQKEALTHAVNIFPKSAIQKITRTQINVNYNLGSEGKQETLQFYVEMESTALIVEEVLRVKDGRYVIEGFHFNEAPMNLMAQFPFSVIPWVQPKNVFLAVGVFNVIFMTVVLVLLVVQPVKQKWLWLPVIFAGFGEAAAQWIDDGPWSFTLLAVKYPSIWLTQAAGQEPWSLMVSYPLGATLVLFLIVTAKPEPVTAPMRPQAGLPSRTPQRRQPRPQPMKVGK